MWAMNILATYHRKNQCSCWFTSQERSRLRHWPSAESFTPASQMRPKNTVATGPAEQNQLIPTDVMEKEKYSAS